MPDPVILVDPQPRTLDLIFDPPTRRRLESLGRLIVHEQGRMPDEMVEAHLPDAVLVIGQTDMPAERLARAPNLRAIFNVEGNFLPNVDYETCFRRGIHVLAISTSFLTAVAEASLGMAIDLARGITSADRAFRAGREGYGLAGNEGCFMFTGSPVGIIGFGDLGRTLRPMLAPFRCPVKVYDPWLSDFHIRAHGCEPASLDELLSTSRVIFVFATVTSENQGFLDRAAFEKIRPGSVFLLMSRAAVVDFPEFVRQVESGRIRAATDVFPEEPVAPDDPVRQVEGLLLSAHRTGGMPEAFHEIGQRVVADAELVLRGLPPLSCKPAIRETIGLMRSKPVTVS